MKNFILLLIIIANIQLSCCKCGPPPKFSGPIFSFNLVVKNLSGEDLLNPASVGGYKKDEIKLYNQMVDGSKKAIVFTVNKPLTASNQKLEYFQLHSTQILPQTGNKKDVTYLQFRDETPYVIDIVAAIGYGGQKSDFMELSINSQQIERDVKLKDYINALFYFTKQ
ncbi:MAG: hypothetical protein EOO07_00635 [Chitinophagaceae bacterium]|nr:MAG: hypothetical protein EOO07_00635 [Chitinophagaceae bacterium]